MAISELDEIISDTKRINALANYQPDRSELKARLTPNTAVGDALRNAPAPNRDELIKRLAPAPAAEPARAPRAVSLNPAQAPGSIADLSRPFVQQQAAPASNPNVAKGILSAEGVEASKRLSGAASVAPAAAPSPLLAPVAEAPAKPSVYRSIVNAASDSARPLVPNTGPASGAIGKIAGAVGSAGLGLAKRAAPFVEPAIEAARVGRVAMDPLATKLDVATQGAEGVGRAATTIAGAGLGGAAGTAFAGPIGGAVGAVAGGIAGYVGGDEAIKALRRSVGLDTQSPVERTDARSAAAAPALIAPAAAQTTPKPAALPAITPVPAAPAAASTAPAAPTIEGVARKPRATPAKPAQAAQTGDGTPAIGSGSVEIYRGSQRSVAVPNGAGGMVEVDGSVFDSGRTREALQAQGRDGAMTPLDRAQALERTKDEATIKSAQIQAGASTGNQSSRNATDLKIAEMGGKDGRADKDNFTMSPNLSDSMTGKETPGVMYNRRTGEIKVNPAVEQAAQQEAQAAIKTKKITKEQANARLASAGFRPIE